MPEHFSGQVSDGGVLVLDEPVRWRAQMAKWAGKRVILEIGQAQSKRSNQTNRYYFGTIVGFFQGIWSQGRAALNLPPYTKEETHSVIVQVTLGSEPGPVPGSMLAKPTRHLPQDVFSERLIRPAREMAWQMYQADIPLPNEPWEVRL
jgi:hypothetical protein